jgi:quinol monooxygenase YgiN
VLAGLLGAALAPRAGSAESPSAGRIVRLSRASFPADRFEAVKRQLESAQETLVPAIRALDGCLHYYAAIDRASSTMINASVWSSLAAAKQMESFAPMQALAEEFARLGVSFERPVANYETLWEI